MRQVRLKDGSTLPASAFPNIQSRNREFQSEYFVDGLLNEETWAALLASGVIDLATLEEIWNNQGAASKAGEFINIPTLNNPAAFARVDRSASSGASFTAAASTDG